MEAQAVLKCPECGSTRVYHDGFRPAPSNSLSNEPIQRFRCADYGHRFSEHTSLNVQDNNKATSQKNVSSRGMELASKQEIKTCMEKERTPTENEIKAAPQIDRFLIQLENDGKEKATVRNYKKYLKILLVNGADLFDPENTKSVLAKKTMKKSSKKLCTALLNGWFDFNGIYWKPPSYSKDNEIPYIPTEEELDQLIAGLGKKTATFCQMLKDTGARSGEIAQLTWKDIDFIQRNVNIKAEKRSNGRVLPLSDKAINMLANLSHKKQRLFGNIDGLRACFFIQRRKIAEKIANPNLLKVHFHTFRHWKATTELHKFHDRERVQIILGHKNANSTETYVHIDKMMYLSKNNDGFIVKVVDDLEDAIKLMESGFEFHIEFAGHKLFRKRK